jgi:hypothetical protein
MISLSIIFIKDFYIILLKLKLFKWTIKMLIQDFFKLYENHLITQQSVLK